MVAETQDEKSSVQLVSDTLTITGKLSIPPDWYEFEAIFNGISLGNIGGQLKNVFVDSLLSVLEKKSGKPLRDIPNAAFKEIVGGDDSEYLDYVVLSNYNTFYFFKEGQHFIHAVLADYHGKLVAHSRIDSQIFHDWNRQLAQ